MVNAWSLAHDVLNGTLDENFPIMTGNIEINTGLGNTASTIPIGGDDYADAVDYMVSEMPGPFTTVSDNDDSIAHHVSLNYDELDLNIQSLSMWPSISINCISICFKFCTRFHVC